MRYGIVSDIHGNLEALQAVLSYLLDLSIDKYVCLGDIVGYGADPCACLDEVRGREMLSIVGNHDAAAVGSVSIELFNTYAAHAIRWTQEQLHAEDRRYLLELPFLVSEDGVSFAHAALHRPEWFEYLRTPHEAFQSFRAQTTKAAFIGHSHIPIAYLLGHEKLVVTFDTEISLAPFRKGIFNVGSVGQPRDQDPRASCATYDPDAEEFVLHRVPYDVDRAAEKILRAGLPTLLAERLRVGV